MPFITQAITGSISHRYRVTRPPAVVFGFVSSGSGNVAPARFLIFLFCHMWMC